MLFWKFLVTNLMFVITNCHLMEQRTLKNVNNSLNTDIYSYLETFGCQISNLYLNVVLEIFGN
jgi:hypothetical protein